MSYYVDILEPAKDLDASLERLSSTVGVLYRDCWNATKRERYGDKPFDLNINAFVNMWFSNALKLFIAYDATTKKPVGFLAGLVLRPLPYNANVFQIEEYYALGGLEDRVEPLLIDHAVQAMKFIGTDEVWISRDSAGKSPKLPEQWKLANEFVLFRYTKE